MDINKNYLNSIKSRQRLTYAFVEVFAEIIVRGGFSYCAEGIKNVPLNGPVLIVSKHISILDPVFNALPLVENTNILPSFPMRPFGIFNRPLEMLGAVLWYRPKEIIERDLEGRKKKKNIDREFAKDSKARAIKFFELDLANGGTVISFVEGGRCPGVMGKINSYFFELGVRVEEKYGNKVSFLPVGLNKIDEKYRPIVSVKYGEPVYYNGNIENLVSKCSEEIKKLSGL